VNLSNVTIPFDVQCLLQLGENFGLPIDKNNIDKALVEFIKHIECNIKGPNNFINFFRNKTIPILDDFYEKFLSSNSNEKLVSSWIKSVFDFVKSHPELLITTADKGNVTVILNRADYISKMENMLSHTNTYERIVKDLTRKIICDLRGLLVRWKNREYIDSHKKTLLLSTDGSIPRAYGLTKIHKQGNPLRIIAFTQLLSPLNAPIVSSINSLLYNLSLFLYNIINKTIPKGGRRLALFTNVPVDLSTDSKISIDTLLIIEDNKIIFDGYHKATFSGRFLNFNSQHPTCHKKGQTKRQLKIRVHEHVSDINKKVKSPPVISNHRIEKNHNFDWENVKILDVEPSYNKRLISEI
ncbi:hypothetical protein ALC62_11809, partial [Cyphomyrmex costatus]